MKKIVFSLGLILIALSTMNATISEKPIFYEGLDEYIKTLPNEFSEIPEKRKVALEALGKVILEKVQNNEEVEIIVICTHNSRRSHLGQLWLKVAAEFYEIPNVKTFSGGTEATAFNPRAVVSLERAGFQIEKLDEKQNPKYAVSFAKNREELINFSKKYSSESNPQKAFIALLVCSSADEACPVVLGADARLAIPYEDPKKFDGTDLEAQKYDERCRQIAREMFYVMQYVKEN